MDNFQKILNFKSITATNNNTLAQKYLTDANWDLTRAIQFYFEDMEKNNKVKNKKKNYNQIKGKLEFKINDALNKTQEIYTKKDKDTFFDIVKFLEKKFYISQNFTNFLASLKKTAGLIIIFPKEKISEVRNNMIRAFNNPLCFDIMKNAAILLVMTESKTCNELIKQIKPYIYPIYLFCKYNSSQIMTINKIVEKKFNLKNVVDSLLECFPNNDIKQSIYDSINNTILQIKDKKPEEKNDDFTGDENEVNNLINKLENNIRISNTIFRKDDRFDNNHFVPKDEQKDGNDNNININDNNNKTEKNRFQNLFGDEIKSHIFNDFDGGEENEEEKKDDEENPIDIQMSLIISVNKVIPDEPNENDPNACKITFAYPYDEKKKQRRFNKTDKIEVLYHYVISLGREIFSNENFHTFELVYGLPTVNLENKKDKTLEEEGLFPLSTIFIIEK